MFNVCHQCGLYRADKTIDPAGPYAICPECGYKHTFRYLPLLIVSGASGTGKSTICNELVGHFTDAVLLDSDILWCPAFNNPENDYRDFFEIWLRMSKNIGQSGQPVVLFGAGAGVPGNIEPCVERRYFSAVHYLALTCDDDILTARLRARPQWRASADDAFSQTQIDFNRWFRETGPTLDPPITTLDTTHSVTEETVKQVAHWIECIVMRDS
ncbi:MAG: AAA family ATPase [Anaerolineae bacterium]|nr:AAA family ATPase [Anaerolineae bacterium]